MSETRAALLIVGSELLDGRRRDENGPFLSASLTAHGVRVDRVMLASDDLDLLTNDLRFLLASEPDVLVVCGGLGTTHDDLTTAAVAAALGLSLVEDAQARSWVEEATRRVSQRRHVPFDELLARTLKEARLPQGSRALPPAGLAPGYRLAFGPTHLFVLPGVPDEIAVMWPPILEELARDGVLADVAVRTVRTYGVGEIQVQPLLDDAAADGLDIAVTASAGEVVIVVQHGRGDAAAAARVERLVADLEETLPVFSSDGRTIDDIVADRLGERGETVAVAESCTGGGLGARLTALPGSSGYFLGGVIAYADEAKMGLLEVPPGMLAQYGAVSEEVAGAMAEGVRATLRATYGVAITGVAGPGGGTAEKPPGLVYLGCSGPLGTVVEERRFPGARDQVRRWAVVAALHLVRSAIPS